jgi:hypothetical protein
VASCHSYCNAVIATRYGAALVQARAELRQSDGRIVSRYRRGWDAGEKANLPDSAADKRGSVASKLANANWERYAASGYTAVLTIIPGEAQRRNPHSDGGLRG